MATGSAIDLSIEELLDAYPGFQVAFALIEDIDPATAGQSGIDRLVAEAETAAAERLGEKDIADLPEIAAWRAAYRRFGSKKTSYRNSCEALLRRLRSGGGLPRVLPLVDLYNALSIKHVIPAGADDLARLRPPLAFRYSRPGDSFLDLARDPPTDDPPAPGEVVLADAEKCLCRRWNWRQDARSRIRPETRDATLVLQTLEADGQSRLSAAAAELSHHVTADLGGRCHWAIASADAPAISLGG